MQVEAPLSTVATRVPATLAELASVGEGTRLDLRADSLDWGRCARGPRGRLPRRGAGRTESRARGARERLAATAGFAQGADRPRRRPGRASRVARPGPLCPVSELLGPASVPVRRDGHPPRSPRASPGRTAPSIGSTPHLRPSRDPIRRDGARTPFHTTHGTAILEETTRERIVMSAAPSSIDHAHDERHDLSRSARRPLRCASCDYQIASYRSLPVCPMCRGVDWESAEWWPVARHRF